MRFVNPKNDVAFRKIFGSEEKTEILIGFLNAVLDLNGEKAIESVQILNPYQTPRLDSLKMTILDVQARDKRGVTFIVEMQIEHTVAIKKRFTYYVAKAYANQIKRGDEYPKLNQVFFIGILDFKLFKQTKPYLSRHQILDIETHKQELEDLEFTFIELPKFDKSADEAETMLEKWIYFIKHAEDLEVIPDHVTDPALQAAYAQANQFGWHPNDLALYDYRGMKIQDERGALEYARLHAEQEGLERGLMRGHAKGHAEGREEGREEGRRQTTLDIARALLANGADITLVANVTGLAIVDIEQLASESQ